MDEQLKKMLLDATQKGVNGIENTVNWVGQQAPELLKNLLVILHVLISLPFVVLGYLWFFIKSAFNCGHDYADTIGEYMAND